MRNKFFILAASLALGACATQTPLDNSPVTKAQRDAAFDYATFIEAGCTVRLKKLSPEAYHDTIPETCQCVRRAAIDAYQPWMIRMMVNESRGIPPTAPPSVAEAEIWRGGELAFKQCGSIY